MSSEFITKALGPSDVFFGVFDANFEHIKYIDLVLILPTLDTLQANTI